MNSRHVLSVAPLSSIPYTGPPLASQQSPIDIESESLPSRTEPTLLVKDQPAMVFLPSHSTEEEWENVLAATRDGIAVTGSAALGTFGRVLGLIDIGESQDSYLFRVSLPGVMREKRFKCDVEPSGKVTITGVTSTGEKRVCRQKMVFEMQSRNLCPPGDFSVSFRLPGPVDEAQIDGSFGNDGIFAGVVSKEKRSIT